METKKGMDSESVLKTEHYRAMGHLDTAFKLYPGLSLENLTRGVAHLLDVEFAGVWFFRDDCRDIFCKILYCKGKDGYEKDLVVNTSRYPVFFRILREKQALVIDDASGCADMEPGHYLDNSAPRAAIFVPVWIDRTIIGIVSLEHAGKSRHWTSMEKGLGSLVADIITLLVRTSLQFNVENIDFLDHLPGIMYRCICDHELNIEFVSEGCFLLTGYHPLELKEKRISYPDIIHPVDRDRVLNEIEYKRKRGLPYSAEYRIITADEQVKWVWEQGRALDVSPEGTTVLDGYIMDISDLKKTEEDFRSAKQWLRTIFNHVNDAIFIHDMNGRIIDVNDKMLEMYGVDRAEALAGKVQDEFTGSKDSEEKLFRYWRGVLDGNRQFFRWKARRPGDGSTFDVEVLLTKLEFGGQDAIMAAVRDITAYKNAEEALRQSEERYKEILSSIEELYLEVDLAGNITFCNEAACRMLGYSREELLGINYRKLHLDPEKVYKAFNLVFRTGKADKGYTMELICKDGSMIYIELSISLIKDKDGKFIGFRGVGRDATKRKQFEEKLKYISMHDQLTGLYNRAYMERELRRLEGKEGCQVSIILVDLDGLKLINDTMGHKKGDELLKKCAGILKQSIRGSDILARFGGDEFAIILPYTGEQAAELVRQRIRAVFEEFNERYPDIHLGVSMGVATSSMDEGSLEDTFNEADDYMYQEKLYRSAEAHEKIAASILKKLDDLDYISTGHAERLEEMSIKLGERFDLSSRQLKDLAILAQAHDVGKISVPGEILFKEQPLTDAEWKIIRAHAEKGYRIARSIPTLARVADLILRHHERWDGTGYPIGLKGSNIPIECRILSIVDAYDVMTHDRPYRKALSTEQAVAELRRCAGTQFDPVIVEEFIGIIEK
ncbi:MAG: PAS domain S-box protein [Firmicutes bacterium]|nr:PAS domain S-box protein [Bacillota bacterium]